MTDTTITAFDFYSSLPLDVLMRIRSSHIDNLATMNEIISDKFGELTENEDGFFLETDDDVMYVGDTVEEAIEFVMSL